MNTLFNLCQKFLVAQNFINRMYLNYLLYKEIHFIPYILLPITLSAEDKIILQIFLNFSGITFAFQMHWFWNLSLLICLCIQLLLPSYIHLVFSSKGLNRFTHMASAVAVCNFLTVTLAPVPLACRIPREPSSDQLT